MTGGFRGITPAYAGKRCCPSHRRSAHRDHPRICGEKWQCEWCGFTRWGSSPRLRGKGQPCGQRGENGRITPAFAGKRGPVPRWSAQAGDHPRVCGEKFCSSLMRALWSGSPPRMQGKAIGVDLHHPEVGITPAYAGKRQFYSPLPCLRRDHPRVCGEKWSPRPCTGRQYRTQRSTRAPHEQSQDPGRSPMPRSPRAPDRTNRRARQKAPD